MSNSLFVESLYQESPVAQEARDLYFEPYRDSVVACLRDNGVEVDDDVARVVAERLIGELMMETGVSCLSGYIPREDEQIDGCIGKEALLMVGRFRRFVSESCRYGSRSHSFSASSLDGLRTRLEPRLTPVTRRAIRSVTKQRSWI
jgi:hypothetical protein